MHVNAEGETLSPIVVRTWEPGQILTEAALTANPQVHAEIAFCSPRSAAPIFGGPFSFRRRIGTIAVP